MMRHRNITLSLSQELITELHLFVKKGEVSRFAEEALEEKLRSKKSLLEQQYIEAAHDEERNAIFKEWDHLSGDGLNEQNNW